MPTLTLIIQAVDDADLINRLTGITEQLKQGYAGAQGKTEAGVFKYLVKDTVKGAEAQLPRIPTTGGNAPSEDELEQADQRPVADESEDDDQDIAGTLPVTSPVLGHPLAIQARQNLSTAA